MQALGINKQLLYYAQFSGYTDITSDGFKTGEKTKVYHTAESMWANVSPRSGTADFEPFGANLDYDRVMVTADMTCPISETSVLWLGAEPSAPHNYIVRKVAKSLNSITYAIKEVTAS